MRIALILALTTAYWCAALSKDCFAIGFASPYGTADNYLDSTSPWLWTALPDDLLYPENAVLGCQGPGCVSGSSAPTNEGNVGVAIAPNWLLGAAHNFGANNSKVAVKLPDPTSSNRGATTIVEYNVAEQIRSSGSLDLVLIRLEDNQGMPANLPYTPLINSDAYPTMAATIGSHGGTYLPDDYPLPGTWNQGASGLRWGRLALSGGSPNANVSILGISMPPRYSVAEISFGDSGGTHFVRDGWDWRVAGEVSTQGGGLTELLPGTAGRAWLENAIGSQLPTQTGSPAPSANVIWSGSGNTPVSKGDVLSVTGNSTMAAPSLEAQDIFVRSAPGSSTTLTQSNSDLTLSGGMFLAPETGDNSVHFVYGGSLSADAIEIGHAGAGSMLTSGAALTTLNAIEVGRENGSNGMLYLGSSQVTANNFAVGVKAGSVGVVDVTAGSSVNAKQTYVGRRGQGDFVNSGSHSSEALSIASHTGAIGMYHLTSNGSLSTNHTQVGGEGQGTFLLGSGLHTTNSLSVGDSSTYNLSGGELQAQTVSIDGRLSLTGGHFNSNSLSGLQIRGELEFAPGANPLSVSGIADLTQADFIAPSGGTIQFGSNALGIVSADSLASMSAAGVSTNHSGQPLHVVGSTLTVDQHTIIGAGVIPDHTVVTTSGTDHGTLVSNGSGILFANGITKELGGIIQGGAAISLNTGRGGVGQASFIEAAPGEIEAPIAIQSGGRLTAEGALLSAIFMAGELEVAAGVGSVQLSGSGSSDPHHSLKVNPGSRLMMDLTSSGNDTISALALNFTHDASVGELVGAPISGTLQIDTPISDINSLPTLTEFSLIGPTAGVWQSQFTADGIFAEIDYGDALYTDFFEEDRAIAVLYDGETPGFAGSSAVEGVSAFVTLPGDFNLDGVVSDADLTILLNNWGTEYGATWMTGDANGDGRVGDADLTAMLNNWQQSLISGGGTGVPEPSTAISLALTGILLLTSQPPRRQTTIRALAI